MLNYQIFKYSPVYKILPYHSGRWSAFSTPHIIFIVAFIIVISAIYLLSKFIKKENQVYKQNTKSFFVWFLFLVQLVCFVMYSANQISTFISVMHSKDNILRFNAFLDIFPTDYCRITQLLSLLIVLIPSTKFFSIVCIYPFIGSILAIFFPSAGPMRGTYDYWYYYEYFISHIVQLAIPFFLFRFCYRKFEKHYFKWSIVYLGLVSLLVIPGNWLLGRTDMELVPTFRAGPIDFTKWIHTSDKVFNKQFGGWLNIMFILLVMGLFGNWLGWLFYRFQKPIKINIKKENDFNK